MLATVGAGEEPGALTNWQALTLGLVQGTTELLPIYSSGHLILVPWLADWTYLEVNDEFNQTFDVALHLGTLVAVALYFRRDMALLVRALVRTLRRRRVEEPSERVAWLIVVATIPAAAAGALGENLIVDRLGEPWQIAILIAFFAVVLYVADRSRTDRRIGDMTLRDAVAITARAAPRPRARGVPPRGDDLGRALPPARPRLVRPLLVPPASPDHARRRRLEGVTDVILGDLPQGSTGPFIVGTLAAAVSGFFAIWVLPRLRPAPHLPVFVVYRLVAAHHPPPHRFGRPQQAF